MRIATLIICLLLCVGPLAAQNWTSQVTRDAFYDAGRVTLSGNLITVLCAARKGQGNLTPNSGWWEVSVAPPGQYLIDFDDQMVPVAPHEVQVQMTLFVDETGYRLPVVHRNEMEGGWQVMLPISDPVFAAVSQASRLLLQVGTAQVWDIPVAGLAAGLQVARAPCEATWAADGQARAAPEANSGRVLSSDLRRAAETFAASNCSDFYVAGPNGLRMANIDGDGIMDVILDYNDITCDHQNRRPAVCGASMCSIDVFLSQTFARTGRPESLMGMSASTVPLSNGNTAVSTSGNLSMCGSLDACAFLWYWNGAQFTELKQ